MERKEIKKQAKQFLKKNFWTLLIVTVFMSFLVGEYNVSNEGFDNIGVIETALRDRNNINIEEENEIDLPFFDDTTEPIISRYVDQSIYDLITGHTREMINNYNINHNVYKGVFFTVFNIVTNRQNQIHNLASSIANYSDSLSQEGVYIIIGSSMAVILQIFILNPFLVGEERIFLESINYNTKFKRLLFPFNKKHYLSVVKTTFLEKLYRTLWNLTIIGGIIKSNSYKMVRFIVAENPSIKSKDAINLSRKMMDGHKMEAFKLDVTFIGWFFLEYITLGIASFYVDPYYKATLTEFYNNLRKEYKENKKENYELLNDDLLYNKEMVKDIYPELYKITNGDIVEYPYEIKEKKKTSNYQKDYDLWSLILMFFIFSFAGWFWECFLLLVQHGSLINRGALYGPWLPIYGFGCTAILILSKNKTIKKMLKNPFATFLLIMVLCTIIEYFTSLYLETTKGFKYWDYTGIFLNLNGRICLESSLFFGIGGCTCLYFVAPYLEDKIKKMSKDTRIAMCITLVSLIIIDTIYSTIQPHVGSGITDENMKSIFEKEE